jgi:hypothetical protein
MEAILLPLTYFGNISYFIHLYDTNEVWIDDQEIYLKQTFRNRAQVLAANGKIDLSVPVLSTKGIEINIDKIKISYDDPWQLKHWRTIVSAYRSSPFFEEFEDDVKELIFSKHELLKDLNLEITIKMLELIGKKKKWQLRSEKELPENIRSLLGYFKPSKMPQSHLDLEPYIQVFNYKYGFTPNLSILDLLFNEGPYALSYLLNASSK